MNNLLKKWLWTPALLIVVVGSLNASLDSNSTHRILLICSYDASFPTFQHQLSGIHSIFDPAEHVVEIEFIDSKRIPLPETIDYFARAMDVKMQVLEPYDLILTADDNALKFVQKYGKQLFGDTPIIFFGVNDRENGLACDSDSSITGILEIASLQENIDLMHQLFPNANRYHVIIDALPSTLGDWKAFQDGCTLPNGVNVSALDLRQLSFHELREKLAQFGERDLVLLLGPYTDKNGKILRFYEAVSLLSESSAVPIFHPYQHGVGEGLLGGMVVSHYIQAKTAAGIGKRVISGEDIGSIPVMTKSPNRYFLDHQMITDLRVPMNRIPEDVIWVNENYSLLQQYRWWIVTVFCVVVFLLGMLLLILQFWQMERSVRKDLVESEERNAKLFENPFAVMLIIDPDDGRILAGNQSAVNFYGYSEQELLKLKISDINSRSASDLQNLIQDVRNLKTDHFRFQHRLKNGDIRDVEVATGPVALGGREVLFSIINDVTESIQKEKDLLLARQNAEDANRAKDQFLSMMSHEMRTPLNPILGFSSMLLEDIEDGSQQELLTHIKQSADRLKSIIDDVLHFNKLNSGSFEINPRVFSPVELCEHLGEMIAVSRGGNRYEFVNNGNSSIPAELSCIGDPDILHHIISNFLSNAFKYTQNGSVILRSSLIEQDQERCLLKFEIEDTGIGIEKSKLAKIFDPFQQIDNSFTRNFEGVGMGLAICQRMARLIDANLVVTSEPGIGSNFAIEVWVEKTS